MLMQDPCHTPGFSMLAWILPVLPTFPGNFPGLFRSIAGRILYRVDFFRDFRVWSRAMVTRAKADVLRANLGVGIPAPYDQMIRELLDDHDELLKDLDELVAAVEGEGYLFVKSLRAKIEGLK